MDAQLIPGSPLEPLTTRYTLEGDWVANIFEFAPTNLMTTAQGRVLCPKCKFKREDAPELFKKAELFGYEAFDKKNPPFLREKTNSEKARENIQDQNIAASTASADGGDDDEQEEEEIEQSEYTPKDTETSSIESGETYLQADECKDNRAMHEFKRKAEDFSTANDWGRWPDNLYGDLKGCGQKEGGAGVAYFRNPPNVLVCINTGEFKGDNWVLRTERCGFSFVPYLKAVPQSLGLAAAGTLGWTKGLVDLTKKIPTLINGTLLSDKNRHKWACPLCVVRVDSIKDQPRLRDYVRSQGSYCATRNLPFYVNPKDDLEESWRVWVNTFERVDLYDMKDKRVTIQGIRCSNVFPDRYSGQHHACNYLYGTPLPSTWHPGCFVANSGAEKERPPTLDKFNDNRVSSPGMLGQQFFIMTAKTGEPAHAKGKKSELEELKRLYNWNEPTQSYLDLPPNDACQEWQWHIYSLPGVKY